MDIAGAITSILGGNNDTAKGIIESVIKKITESNAGTVATANTEAAGIDIDSITKAIANGNAGNITDILKQLGVGTNAAGSLSNMSVTDIISAAGSAADVLKNIFGANKG